MLNNLPSNSISASASLVPTTLPEVPDLSFGGGVSLAQILAGSFVGSTTSASLGTILTLSVPGVLELCAIQAAASVADAQLKITLDGLVIYDKTATLAANQIRNAAGAIGSTSIVSAVEIGSASLVSLPFKTLLIQTASDGSDTLNCLFRYHLTSV